jgi:hypothetical protein
MGSKLCAKPHRKNKEVINIKGIRSDLVFCIAHKLYLNIIYPKHTSKKFACRIALKEAKGLLLNKFQIILQHNLNRAEANKTFSLTNQ